MGDIVTLVKVGFAALIVSQIVVLGVRFRTCEAKGELVRFAFLLCFLAFRLLLPSSSPISTPLSVVVWWASGELFIDILGYRGSLAWGLANAVYLAAFFLVSSLGYRDTLPMTVVCGISLGLFALFPLFLLARAVRRTRSIADGSALVFGILLLITGGIDIFLALMGRRPLDLGSWPVCMISCSTGYIIFQEGYLLKNSWRSLEARLSGQEKLMRAAYARLLQTENALLLQDRLIVSGLLAMGAAHEFKNALAHIRTTAEFGLSRREMEGKDECLRLLAEHAEVGAKAAVDFLERLSREGREEARSLVVEELVAGFLRLTRPAYRMQGILFRSVLEPGVRIMARSGEIEQVLLNLAVNAAESFRRNRGEGERVIEIASGRVDGTAFVDVTDNAGGVAPDASSRLFSVSPNGEGRTGLGLYLSRSLAERNGGTLEYTAVEGGSRFRLALPLGGNGPQGTVSR